MLASHYEGHYRKASLVFMFLFCLGFPGAPGALGQNASDSGLVGLAVGGAVLSQQADSFNQSDPFFGFIAGYHGKPSAKGFGTNFNLRFDGYFTATPRSAEGTNTSAPAGTPPSLDEFVASRKSFDTTVQLWYEFGSSKPLTIGPYVSGTASAALDRHELETEAVTSDDEGAAATPSASRVLTNVTSESDLKRRFEGGAVVHLYREDQKLFLQSFVGYGNDESMDGLSPGHNTKHRFIGRLRVFPEGLSRGLNSDAKKFTPMFGVELNAGRGPDHLKFFTGFVVDLTAFK